MKKNIHPTLHAAVFQDVSTNFSFLATTTMTSKDSIEWSDGKTYPLIKLDVSSASHPFYTGKTRAAGAEDRAEKFKKKYAAFNESKAAKI